MKMLLTEIVKKTRTAVEKHRDLNERKKNIDNYRRAMAQLAKATESIKTSLDSADAMKKNGIINAPMIDKSARDGLLECIDSCGKGVSEIELTMETVNLLKSKGEMLQSLVRSSWRETAVRYSEGPKGYLSMIGGLSDDPRRAKELAENITALTAAEPTPKRIENLVTYVTESNDIINGFSLNPEIEGFLKKVSIQQATVLDLTPEVMTWLKEKKLVGKLRVRF